MYILMCLNIVSTFRSIFCQHVNNFLAKNEYRYELSLFPRYVVDMFRCYDICMFCCCHGYGIWILVFCCCKNKIAIWLN